MQKYYYEEGIITYKNGIPQLINGNPHKLSKATSKKSLI
jgi:hypothetical protein